MRNTLLASALAIATLAFPAFAQQPATGGTVVTSEPGKASIARAAEVSARVVGIDKATRSRTSTRSVSATWSSRATCRRSRSS
jgi:hypothetical protein